MKAWTQREWEEFLSHLATLFVTSFAAVAFALAYVERRPPFGSVSPSSNSSTTRAR